MLHFCDFEGCNASFSRPGRLKTHKLTHAGSRLYECKVPGCDKSYFSNQHLTRHIRYKHEPKEEEFFVCFREGCNKAIYTSQGFHGHLWNHDKDKNKEKPIIPTCKHCQKTFRYKSVLETHEKRAHKVVPCDEEGCSKTFSNLNLLRNHIAVDHKLPPLVFICDYCKREFRRKSIIRTHMINLHLANEKVRHVCQIDKNCGKQFRCERYLWNHVARMHPTDKKFIQCDVEGFKKEYRGKQPLKGHEAKHARKDQK